MQQLDQKSIDEVLSEVPSPLPRILLAEDLRKSYGSRPALRGLSFSLQAGHILGFLGPNGAGKTTAIRILTTILKADSGNFVVGGINDEYPEKIRRLIGVLPESMGYPKQITGIDYLTFFGQLYGKKKIAARTNAMALLEEVGMQQRAKSPIGTYSRGMRQRLGIARAIVNDPVVMFLDEPTLGLDPRGQQELLEMIRRVARERNTGVILCSHHLAEIEGTCDDVVILNQGQVVASGPVIEVMRRARQNLTQGNALRIQVPPPSVAEAQHLLEMIPKVLKVTVTSEEAGWLLLELKKRRSETSSEANPINNTILEALIRAEIHVLSFGYEGGRLQDVFLQLTSEVTEWPTDKT